MIVKTYTMKTASGKNIRQATMVIIDGREIRFTEKMSKKEAIKNALHQINK